jgi:hypothetical protein
MRAKKYAMAPPGVSGWRGVEKGEWKVGRGRARRWDQSEELLVELEAGAFSLVPPDEPEVPLEEPDVPFDEPEPPFDEPEPPSDEPESEDAESERRVFEDEPWSFL